MTTHPSMRPSETEAEVFHEQLATLMATSERTLTSPDLMNMAPPRVLAHPCNWGTCLPRTDSRSMIVAEFHDQDAGLHYLHRKRTWGEVGAALGIMVGRGWVKLITYTDDDHQRCKAWLWVGPPRPVGSDPLEELWVLS